MYTLSIFYSLLIFISVVLILVSFGYKLFKIFAGIKTSLLSKFIYSFVLGFGVFGYVLYLVGILRLFYFWAVWCLLILILIISYKELIFWLNNIHIKIKSFSFSKLAKQKFLLILLILIAVWLIVVFIGAASPLIEFDSRWYHFGEAKYYLENHRVSIETFWGGTRTPSIFWPSAFPRLAEIFFAIFLSFKAEIAAKLINFGFGLIGILAIFDYARRKMDSLSALIAGLVALVVIPFFVNVIYGYIDLIVFGIAAVSFLAIFSWLDDKKASINFLILAGIIGGLGCSTKLNAIFIVPIILLLIVVQELIFKRNIKRALLFPVIYLFFVFIFSFAWYLDNRLNTGSFTYPLGSIQAEAALRENVLAGSFNLFMNVMLLIFPLIGLAVFGLRKRFARIIFFLLATSIIYYVFWDWGSNAVNEPRYLMPALFGLAVVAGLGFSYLYNLSRLARISVSIFIVLIIVVQTIMAVKVEKRYYPYILGLKSRKQYLTEVVAPDWWSIYDYNGEIKKTIGNSKALMTYNIWHTYYVDFKATHASLSKINFSQINSVRLLAEKIKENGYNFVITKKGDLGQLLIFTAIPNQQTTGDDANPEIRKYFENVHQDDYSEIIIYKVK